MNAEFVKRARLFGVLFIVALAMVSAVTHAQEVSSIDGVLSVTGLSLSPAPVLAGQNVTLAFSLFNSYSQSLQNVNVQLTSSSQILNVSPAYGTIVTSIGAGQYGSLNSFSPFVFKLHIPSTLASGVYTIDVVANYESPVTATGPDVPGQSVIPITFYVYGVPELHFNIVPQTTLSPGTLTSVTIQAVNTGTDTATNVTASILNSQSFQIAGQDGFNFGTIAAGGLSSASTTLLVAQNITSGTHNLSVQVTYKNSIKNYSYVSNVPISIQVGKPDIIVSIVSAMPQQLYSGSNQSITLLIQNIGNGAAKNVSVNLESSSVLNIQSSVSSFYLGTINAGSSATEVAYINANSTKFYNSTTNLPIKVSYYNANYQNKTSTTQNLQLSVASSAILNIDGETGQLYPGNSYGALTVEVTNTGNEAAKEITFSLQSIYPISPIAGDAYVNFLGPGNSTSVTFYVSADSNGKAGSYPITVYEQWKQPDASSNQQFSGSSNYDAQVYASQGAAAAAGIPYAEIVVAVVIVAAAVLVYRRMMKSKKNTKPKHD